MIIFALLFLYPWQPVIEQQRAQSGACLSGKRDRKTSFVMLRFQKKKNCIGQESVSFAGFHLALFLSVRREHMKTT